MARRVSIDKTEQPQVPTLSTPEDQPTQPNGADTGIPSPDAGDELDEFARYAVEDAVTSQTGEVSFCSVGPPNRLHYFRAHTDTRMYRDLHFLTIEEENKKRSYLVRSDLTGRPEFEGRTKVARTAPWVNENGAIGVWLISIEHDDNSWVRSALNTIEKARHEWICAVPLKKAGQYTIHPSIRDRGEPKWPSLDFSGWMKLAFPPDMRIDSSDHPIAKHLRGE